MGRRGAPRRSLPTPHAVSSPAWLGSLVSPRSHLKAATSVPLATCPQGSGDWELSSALDEGGIAHPPLFSRMGKSGNCFRARQGGGGRRVESQDRHWQGPGTLDSI